MSRPKGTGAGMDGSSSTAPKTRPPKPPEAARPLPPTPGADGAPITDVNALSVVSPVVAAKIKAAAGLGTAALQASESEAAARAPEVDKPGTERWPVKTGQDQDRAKVGKNIINGQNLGAGIVESAIAELITLPRPPGLQVATTPPGAARAGRGDNGGRNTNAHGGVCWGQPVADKHPASETGGGPKAGEESFSPILRFGQ